MLFRSPSLCFSDAQPFLLVSRESPADMIDLAIAVLKICHEPEPKGHLRSSCSAGIHRDTIGGFESGDDALLHLFNIFQDNQVNHLRWAGQVFLGYPVSCSILRS